MPSLMPVRPRLPLRRKHRRRRPHPNQHLRLLRPKRLCRLLRRHQPQVLRLSQQLRHQPRHRRNRRRLRLHRLLLPRLHRRRIQQRMPVRHLARLVRVLVTTRSARAVAQVCNVRLVRVRVTIHSAPAAVQECVREFPAHLGVTPVRCLLARRIVKVHQVPVPAVVLAGRVVPVGAVATAAVVRAVPRAAVANAPVVVAVVQVAVATAVVVAVVVPVAASAVVPAVRVDPGKEPRAVPSVVAVVAAVSGPLADASPSVRSVKSSTTWRRPPSVASQSRWVTAGSSGCLVAHP